MWVWPQLVFGGSPPPIPHCNWRTLPSSQTPSLPALSFPLPPTPLGSFCKAPGGGGPGWWGGGVPGRKGVEGSQGARGWSGTWGQTHIWGYSIEALINSPRKNRTTSSWASFWLICGSFAQTAIQRCWERAHRALVVKALLHADAAAAAAAATASVELQSKSDRDSTVSSSLSSSLCATSKGGTSHAQSIYQFGARKMRKN